jgi:hypothetical protein
MDYEDKLNDQQRVWSNMGPLLFLSLPVQAREKPIAPTKIDVAHGLRGVWQ